MLKYFKTSYKTIKLALKAYARTSFVCIVWLNGDLLDYINTSKYKTIANASHNYIITIHKDTH